MLLNFFIIRSQLTFLVVYCNFTAAIIKNSKNIHMCKIFVLIFKRDHSQVTSIKKWDFQSLSIKLSYKKYFLLNSSHFALNKYYTSQVNDPQTLFFLLLISNVKDIYKQKSNKKTKPHRGLSIYFCLKFAL